MSVNKWKICGNRTSEHMQSGVRLLSLRALIWRDEFTHAEFAGFCKRILHQKASYAKLIGLWRSEQSLHLCETSGQLSTERSFDIREKWHVWKYEIFTTYITSFILWKNFKMLLPQQPPKLENKNCHKFTTFQCRFDYIGKNQTLCNWFHGPMLSNIFWVLFIYVRKSYSISP